MKTFSLHPVSFSRDYPYKIYSGTAAHQIITRQGLFGSVPWRALDFLVIFLQYCGLDDGARPLSARCTHTSIAPDRSPQPGVLGAFVRFGARSSPGTDRHRQAPRARPHCRFVRPFTNRTLMRPAPTGTAALTASSFAIGQAVRARGRSARGRYRASASYRIREEIRRRDF